MISFRIATLQDADYLLPRLRPIDSLEVRAVVGQGNELRTMRQGIKEAERCRVALQDGEPIAIFGVNASARDDFGVVWFLGTPDVERHPREMLTCGRAFRHVAHYRFRGLYNFVHADNKKSIRWLKKLGYTIEDKITSFGAEQNPFHLFFSYNHV